MIQTCRFCTKPEGKIEDEICQLCVDTIERYGEFGILNMAHAPYMKVYFFEGKVYYPLRYADLKDIIEDEE